jgi:ComF family protein
MWLHRLAEAGRELGRGFLELLYPGACLLCGVPLPEGLSDFCDGCRTALFFDPNPSCPCCGATVGPFAVVNGRCALCRLDTLPFARTLRLGPYEGKRRDAILRLKRAAGEGLAELLGRRWAEQAEERFRALEVDALVPVPLHWRRWLWRGYNQSAAICRGLSAHLHLPTHASWLRRIRNTPLQTGQSRTGRLANVRGAFAAGRAAPLLNRHILLVDDVMTTGATAIEAAQTLRNAGAARVAIAVLARVEA